jgi:hypothetical protein
LSSRSAVAHVGMTRLVHGPPYAAPWRGE